MSLYEPSRLDIDRMSLSNNLSELYINKPEDINLYSDIGPPKAKESQCVSGISLKRGSEGLPFPVSDPQFSSQKLTKNKKMKDFLHRINQNVSNKSFISLQENKELFSRRNSSLQDSGNGRLKGSLVNKKLVGQVKLRMANKTSHSPRTFKFSDVLEEKKPFDVAILEYPDNSNFRAASFQSSKNSEKKNVKQVLNNTKKTSFLGNDISINKSKNVKIKEPQKTNNNFDQYEELCKELTQQVISDILAKQTRDREQQTQKDLKLQAAEKEKRRRDWGKSVRTFERHSREFISAKDFPFRISPEEVGEFLQNFADFLCANKLDEIVFNINKGKFLSPTYLVLL